VPHLQVMCALGRSAIHKCLCCECETAVLTQCSTTLSQARLFYIRRATQSEDDVEHAITLGVRNDVGSLQYL
jgi:hypothetical protein